MLFFNSLQGFMLFLVLHIFPYMQQTITFLSLLSNSINKTSL